MKKDKFKNIQTRDSSYKIKRIFCHVPNYLALAFVKYYTNLQLVMGQ